MRVLIVGGGSGIGAAVAHRFAADGVEVVIVGRNEANLTAVAGSIGPAATPRVLDASDGEAVAAFFAEPTTYDHLVLAASGAKGAGPFGTLPLRELRDGFESKFWIHLLVLQAALPRLAPTASVTFVTAGSSRAAMAGTAGLAAINGALDAMVRPLATELGPRRVNAVSPGIIETPWWDAVEAETRAAMFAGYARAVPVGRVGQPDEVAAMIVAVAGNGLVTGSVIDCSGGAQLATGRP